MLYKKIRLLAAITVCSLTLTTAGATVVSASEEQVVENAFAQKTQDDKTSDANEEIKEEATKEETKEATKEETKEENNKEQTNEESKKEDDKKENDKKENESKTEEATDTSTTTTGTGSESQEGDKVVISEKDKPYLALGANLSDDQKKTVLSLMGIDPATLDNYDVLYVTNEEEHSYLGNYIPSNEIGTRSLSSVVITKAKAGDGLSIATYNINYCTVGMYKNALATAGISDANIIVAGPTSISGTAALVGIFKAYEEMSGEKIDEQIVDAAMDELVTTGELNQSIDGDPAKIEAMIADLKQQIANGALDNEDEIREAIKEAAKKYDLALTDENIEKILALLNKLKDLDLDWDTIADRAAELADKLNIDITSEGFWDSLIAFLTKLVDAITAMFE